MTSVDRFIPRSVRFGLPVDGGACLPESFGGHDEMGGNMAFQRPVIRGRSLDVERDPDAAAGQVLDTRDSRNKNILEPQRVDQWKFNIFAHRRLILQIIKKVAECSGKLLIKSTIGFWGIFIKFWSNRGEILKIILPVVAAGFFALSACVISAITVGVF